MPALSVASGLGANLQDRAKLGIAGAAFGQLITVDDKGVWLQPITPSWNR